MLSILIPTYNQDVTALVGALHRQVEQLTVPCEIIVMEDGSTQYLDVNFRVSELRYCMYIVNTQNSGRSAVRNQLARRASYDFLLFIDCDATVISDQYLEKYLPYCTDNYVVIGGTAYDSTLVDPRYSLRLLYGRHREANSQYLKEASHNNFATFQFLISKALFLQILFDESIRGYGHEDTLFGHELRSKGYSFIRIDNPLLHNGIDDNFVFLSKTEESVKNLLLLHESGRYPFLVGESRLLQTFVLLQKLRLTGLMRIKLRITRAMILRQLQSKHPSLLVYDLYKLLLLCQWESKTDKMTA